jgi:hypothetical protein
MRAQQRYKPDGAPIMFVVRGWIRQQYAFSVGCVVTMFGKISGDTMPLLLFSAMLWD